MKAVALGLLVASMLLPRVTSAQSICSFRGLLSGSQVVPPTTSSGEGELLGDFPDGPVGCAAGDSSNFHVRLTYSNLTGVLIGAEIRQGEFGSNGELVEIITDEWFPRWQEFLVTLPSTYFPDLYDRKLYVLFRTDVFPEGELRSQLWWDTTPAQHSGWGRLRFLYR